MNIPCMNNQRGFTLVEAVVSIAFISLSLMVITQMQLSSIKGNASATNVFQTAIASSGIADLTMSETFDLASDVTPKTTTSGKYTITRTFQNIPLYNTDKTTDKNQATIQLVTIRVSWLENGQTKNYQTTMTNHI